MSEFGPSARLRRPKTAHGNMTFGTDLAAANSLGQRPYRPSSQMSRRSESPALVPIRRLPSSMKRNIEIQTDPNSAMGDFQAYGVSSGQGTSVPDASMFQTQLLLPPEQPHQQQLMMISPNQMPGFVGLPVMDERQLQQLQQQFQQQQFQQQLLLNPYGQNVRRVASARPAPTFRSGRNGSCWRHVRQCTGNLGNNIMFIDGHVKEEDCKIYPPHGYPSAALGTMPTLSVYSRLAPKAEIRGFAGQRGTRATLDTQALQRAKTGTRYWFEDRQARGLVPNTIQGRIMKSGAAY